MRYQLMRYFSLLSLLIGLSTESWAASYTFTTIDVPGARGTEAHGINATGQIVGQFFGFTGSTHGFLDTDGVFTTIDVPGAFSTEALGINDAGQIVGKFGDPTGRIHGFLAIPVPEPSTLPLLAIGLLIAIGVTALRRCVTMQRNPPYR